METQCYVAAFEKLKNEFKSLKINLKKDLCELLKEGSIEFDYKKIYELENYITVPTAIVSCKDPDTLFIEYYLREDIEEYGFNEAENYNDFIDCFTFDELYFLSKCIRDYVKQ